MDSVSDSKYKFYMETRVIENAMDELAMGVSVTMMLTFGNEIAWAIRMVPSMHRMQDGSGNITLFREDGKYTMRNGVEISYRSLPDSVIDQFCQFVIDTCLQFLPYYTFVSPSGKRVTNVEDLKVEFIAKWEQSRGSKN